MNISHLVTWLSNISTDVTRILKNDGASVLKICEVKSKPKICCEMII